MDSLALQQANAVTLTMEVSYPFHSHLIGRSGQNINKLMDQTGTRIHFPDRNRIAGQSKSNKVVVRGQLSNLENARQRLRASIPVEFVIDCRTDRVSSLGQERLMTHFSTTFGVLLRFYPKIDGISCQVNIRGHQDRIDRLKEAVLYFCRVTHTVFDSVVMKLETSFDHVWFVREHIDKIVRLTGAGIRCPDLSSFKELPKKYSIWIRGSMDGVYAASFLLTGLLPLQLMFQASRGSIDKRFVSIAQEMDILLQYENSGLDVLSVRLSSYEWNARNLYQLVLLGGGITTPVSYCIQTKCILELKEMSKKCYLPSLKRLLDELSSVHLGGNQPSELVEMPQQSPESGIVISPPRSTVGEPGVPASLSASRFSADSFRHLEELLDTLGLSRYIDLFRSHDIDMAMFTTLTESELDRIGVKSFGARKIMLNAIVELRS